MDCFHPTLPSPTLLTSPTEADADAPAAEPLRRILLTGRLMTAVADHLCRVRHISTTTMIVECVADLTVDARVRIELRNRTMIDARIHWAEDGRAGLVFDAPIVIDDVLNSDLDRPDRHPRAPRLTANCSMLLWHVGRQRAATLYNISQSGCRLLTASPPPAGSDVRITVPGLPSRHAVTRWAFPGRAGFLFQDMLSFADLSAWQRDYATRFANGIPVDEA